jgi:Ca-activated chloride channel family protein
MAPSQRLFAGAAVILLAVVCVTQAQNARSGSGSKAIPTVPQLRTGVEVVLVPVTVTDEQNRYVTSLGRGHFQIWEDSIEQKVEYFSTEDAAMSLGILLDISSSMKATIRDASRNVNQCFKASDLNDEFFLVLFASTAQPATEFTTDIRTLQNLILFLNAKGKTALYDAVYNGLKKMKEGVNPRKALVIASDGGENSSRHDAGDLKAMLREQDLQVYTIGNESDGAIRELTQLTGGRALTGVNTGSLGNVCSAMVEELKYQYMLGYKSSNPLRDGRWRDIRLKMTPPPGLSKLHTRHKRGYFAGDEKDNPDATLNVH